MISFVIPSRLLTVFLVFNAMLLSILNKQIQGKVTVWTWDLQRPKHLNGYTWRIIPVSK